MELLKRPLGDYIRHRFGDQAELLSEERFPRGSSRLTYFVEYRPASGEELIAVVFRGDFQGGSTIHTSLEQEYYMYDRLSATDVPVAKVIAWEDDPDWADRPFYIREQIEGNWVVPHFDDPDPRFDDLRIAICKEHLRKIAIVHKVDWKALGLDERLAPPPDRESAGRHFLERALANLREYQREPMPVLNEAVAIFRRGSPPAPVIALCKGTNGIGEEVFNDGQIVAMSDWEEASIGDPAADFASMQSMYPVIMRDGEPIWGLQHAIDYYNEVSGHGVTRANVDYYLSLRTLGSILYGQKSAVIMHEGKADIRQGWTGTEVFYLMKRMNGAVAGLCDPIDPNWFAELNETVI
ncbi:phosphotransferase family protein [Sphingobium sp. AN558]|uniref:phosphotransferase family protein n=1 Tax=Sphingobium sp. AN558 TaxID=3133442 RepID=UPI0030C207F6